MLFFDWKNGTFFTLFNAKEWCRAGYNSHFTIVEGSHGREVPEYVPPEDETLGTCCYRGKTNSTDMYLGNITIVTSFSFQTLKKSSTKSGGMRSIGPSDEIFHESPGAAPVKMWRKIPPAQSRAAVLVVVVPGVQDPGVMD